MGNVNHYIIASSLTEAVKTGRAVKQSSVEAKANARHLSYETSGYVLVVQVKRTINSMSAEAIYLTVARFKDGYEISLLNNKMKGL